MWDCMSFRRQITLSAPFTTSGTFSTRSASGLPTWYPLVAADHRPDGKKRHSRRADRQFVFRLRPGLIRQFDSDRGCPPFGCSSLPTMDNTRTCEPCQDQIRTFSAKGQEVDMHHLQTFEQNGAASPQISPSPSSFEELLPTRPLKSESEFYQEYSWSLNVFPTFREIVRYLARDLQRFEQVELDWRRSEAWTNVHLLAGSITNTLDDYLLGDHYDLSRAAGMVPFLRLGFRAAEEILNMPSRLRTKRLSSLLAWREKWTAAVDEFLFQSFADGELSPRVSSETKQRSLGLLSSTFPRTSLDPSPRIP